MEGRASGAVRDAMADWARLFGLGIRKSKSSGTNLLGFGEEVEPAEEAVDFGIAARPRTDSEDLEHRSASIEHCVSDRDAFALGVAPVNDSRPRCPSTSMSRTTAFVALFALLPAARRSPRGTLVSASAKYRTEKTRPFAEINRKACSPDSSVVSVGGAG